MQVAGETSYCGDGFVDEANGETCEGGNDINIDACANAAKRLYAAMVSWVTKNAMMLKTMELWSPLRLRKLLDLW